LDASVQRAGDYVEWREFMKHLCTLLSRTHLAMLQFSGTPCPTNKPLLIAVLARFDNNPLGFHWWTLPFALTRSGLCLWEKWPIENDLRKSSDCILK
jgi:hypothetical protein